MKKVSLAVLLLSGLTFMGFSSDKAERAGATPAETGSPSTTTVSNPETMVMTTYTYKFTMKALPVAGGNPEDEAVLADWGSVTYTDNPSCFQSTKVRINQTSSKTLGYYHTGPVLVDVSTVPPFRWGCPVL